jgi:hypothetical protein
MKKQGDMLEEMHMKKMDDGMFSSPLLMIPLLRRMRTIDSEDAIT